MNFKKPPQYQKQSLKISREDKNVRNNNKRLSAWPQLFKGWITLSTQYYTVDKMYSNQFIL